MKKDLTESTLNTIESTLKTVEQKVESYTAPVRKSIFKRFPVFFSLFVTFGIAAVFFGFERILEDMSYMNEHPILILSLGILVLVVTGTLYKKL